MRSWFAVSSLCFAMQLACAPPPPPPAPPPLTSFTEAQEAEVLAQHDAAESLAKVPQPDWAAFVDAYYAPDAIVLQPNGDNVVGRDAIIAYFASFPPASKWETRTVSIHGAGDHAVLHTVYEIVTNPPGAEPVRDVGKSLVVKRRMPDGSWKTTHDMFVSDLPVGPPPEAPAEPAPAE